MQSIKYKILTAFLIVISVLVISEAFFSTVYFLSIQRYQVITENMVSEYRIIEDTNSLIASFNNLIKYVNDKGRVNEYSVNRAALITLLATLDKTITNPDSQIAYTGLKNTVTAVLAYLDSGVNSVSQGNLTDITTDYNEANHKNLFVQQNTATLILDEIQYTEKLQVDIARNQLISEVVGGSLFILIILACIWYSFFFSQRLISPLTKLTKLARIIKDGNLDTEMEPALLKGGDEVASLANSFNSMVNSLQANIKQLREYNETIAKTRRVVTEREARIIQLQEINRMKDEFMNIVTHELKTPLIPIVGLSEVMGEKKETLTPEFQDYVSIIHESAEKLTGLIKQILTATRNKNVNREIAKESFNFTDFVLAQEVPLKELAKRTNSKIEFKIINKDFLITSDKEKISQVIFNLVDNSVKYGTPGQTISITVSQPSKKTAKVEITDQGKGIPPKLQDMLFLKFSQLEPSASRSQEGMGLGLYICKQNIESLGGVIGVKSEIDHGSTFYFVLPLEYKNKKEEENFAPVNRAIRPLAKKAKVKKNPSPQ